MSFVVRRQVSRVRRFNRNVFSSTSRGRTWIKMVRPHWREVVLLLAADPRLRDDTQRFLAEVALVVRDHERGRPAIVSDRTVSAATRVLDGLSVRASQALGATVTAIRHDVNEARGRQLNDVMGDA